MYFYHVKSSFFLLLFSLTGMGMSQAQSNWYRCVINEFEGIRQLETIQLIASDVSYNSYSQFHHWSSPLQYTVTQSTESSSEIVVLDFDQFEKYVLVDHATNTSGMQTIPNSIDHSFIIHGTEDVLVRSSDSLYQVIHTDHHINDYDWITANELAIIALDETNTPSCYILNVSEGSKKDISIHPGQSVRRLSDDEVAFIDIFSGAYRYIKSYHLRERRSRIIIKIPSDVDRFTSLGADTFFISSADKILYYVRNKHATWQPFHSFSAYGIKSIKNIYAFKNNTFIFENEN